jgi:hypothetical protein
MNYDDDHTVEVTAENFGTLLIAGMREALAISREEAQPVRRVRRLVAQPRSGCGESMDGAE